jgi:RNA polymerase sigma factor (sigma-70 family)
MNDSFHSHRRRLLDLARSLLGSQADAEDAVQDAWLRAHADMPRELRSAEAWLTTVVKHVAIDRLRRRQLEREVVARAGDLGVELAEPSAEQVAAAGLDGAAALRHLAATLTPVEAAALLLREVFDADYADIAHSAKKGEAACRQIVHRALKRVRSAPPREPRDETADALFQICWRAIATCNPAALHAVLASPEVMAVARTPAPICAAGPGRIRQGIAHVGGRFAVVVVMDGQVLCTLPIGAMVTATMREV